MIDFIVLIVEIMLWVVLVVGVDLDVFLLKTPKAADVGINYALSVGLDSCRDECSSNEMIETVLSVYKDDIDLFGYEF